MRPLSDGLWHLYRRTKVALNALLYRVIESCSLILSDICEVPWPGLQKILREIAHAVGDVCWLLRDLPRLSAHKLIGEGWTIVFVGDTYSLARVRHLFFAEREVEQQELGRFALWKLPRHAECWLGEGTDLVICEVSRIYPWHFRLPVTFRIPVWIRQVVVIPDPPEKLLVGKYQDGARFRVNRARRNGFDWRVSHMEAEFEHFYHRMYLPFVQGRHRDLAMITPYQQQYRKFRKGEVLFITRNGHAVAGSLGYVSGDTYHGVEYGILDNDSYLFQQGIGVLVIWYSVLRAHQKKCRFLDLGGSHAWCSNGVFEYKQRWRPLVQRANEIYSTWVFAARELSPEQEEHLNHIGFICEIRGNFYRILVKNDSQSLDQESLNRELTEAQRQGLTGVAVIAPDSPIALYRAGGDWS